MSKEKIIVMGSFKTGTSSIHNLIAKSKDNIELLNGKHNRGLKNLDFDTIIIPIRKHTEIFQSAYFQDITKKSYPYFYNEENDIILNEKVEILANHFLENNWEKFSYLSPNTSIKYLKQIIKGDLNIKLNDKLYYLNEHVNKFTNKKFKVLIIGFCYLSFENVQNIFKKININIEKKFFHGNNGNKKWYAKKYIEFKKYLKKSEEYKTYLKKYKYLDNKLFDNSQTNLS